MWKRIIISCLLSLSFIVLTGWIGLFLHTPWIWEFCFSFHLIPFGIGYSGGSDTQIFMYYLLLWAILSFFIYGLIHFFSRLFH